MYATHGVVDMNIDFVSHVKGVQRLRCSREELSLSLGENFSEVEH